MFRCDVDVMESLELGGVFLVLNTAYVFTDRHDIFSSGIPAQGTNFLSVALQFPRNGTIRAALNDLLPITGELY